MRGAPPGAPPQPRLDRPGGDPAGPAIDPRLRARRVQVRRSQGRRRLRLLGGAVCALAVVGAVVVATRSPLLDVDHLVVVGAAETDPALVADTAGFALGDPLVELDRGAARRQIRRLPWVADVSIDRGWGGTVTIRVAERVAVASVTARASDAPGDPNAVPARWAVVDATGRVLETGAEQPAGLPRLDGVAPAGVPGSTLDDDAAGALRVAAALPGVLGGSVTAVSASPAGGPGVELGLAGGGVVRLGTTAELRDKLVAAATVLEHPDGACVAVLDVRVPASPALTPRPGCA